MSGRKGMDSLKCTHSRSNCLHQLVEGRLAVKSCRDGRVSENRFDFRPIDQSLLIRRNPVKHWPYPKTVAQQEQFVFGSVVQGKGKFSPQMLGKVHTHLTVQTECNF